LFLQCTVSFPFSVSTQDMDFSITCSCFFSQKPASSVALNAVKWILKMNFRIGFQSFMSITSIAIVRLHVQYHFRFWKLSSVAAISFSLFSNFKILASQSPIVPKHLRHHIWMFSDPHKDSFRHRCKLWAKCANSLKPSFLVAKQLSFLSK
jgi:hypothetical protein